MQAGSRASLESIKDAYSHIFKSGLSFSAIRNAALADRPFLSPKSNPITTPSIGTIELPGRSMLWKLFLVPTEPLDADINLTHLLESLHTTRKHYAQLMLEKMRAPDGSLGEGFVSPGPPSARLHSSESVQQSQGSSRENLQKNNPLSLHVENPWTEWFAQVELRKTIHQDVERTFPEIDFFRNSEVQDQLTTALYLFCSMHKDVGYRQGMHELFAPVYYAMDFDSLPDVEEDFVTGFDVDPNLRELCSRGWVAADAWAVFSSMMRGTLRWYEWQEPSLTSRSIPTSTSTIPNQVHINLGEVSGEMKPYVAPIIQTCNHIQSSLLKATDPMLWKHMQATGIEPQIYGIRWLRLLFTREFSMADAMKLWDAMIATDPSFELAPWICVAMLIRIRNELLPSDYSGQLATLLRYPSPHSPATVVHHTTLLVRQALELQMTPTPSTGSALIMENRNYLDIPAEVPEPQPIPKRRTPINTPDSKASREASHARQTSGSQQRIGIPESIARSLLERGEHLGINKTLMNAVAEIRRNIPDLSSSFGKASTSDYLLEPDVNPEDRPPWEPRSRREMELELARLKSTNKRLGEALQWSVDILLQDQPDAPNPERLKIRKRSAIETLAYTRDVLLNGILDLEEERLGDEEELARRAQQVLRNLAAPESEKPRVSVAQPHRLPVIDSHKPLSPAIPRTPSLGPQLPSPVPSSRQSSPTNHYKDRVRGASTLAPWSYTRSSFGEPSGLPSTALPRLPPPVSSVPAVHQPNETREQVVKPEKSKSRSSIQDPLGVM